MLEGRSARGIMEKRINLNKVNHLARAALENGIRLHFDAIALYKKGSYSTAYFLSIIALEELGKAFLIDHFWWHSRIDGRMEPEMEKDWMNIIYDHKVKQRNYAYFFDGPIIESRVMNDIKNGAVEYIKQNSIYVGLGNNRREININAKINNPKNSVELKQKR